jgi:two-component system, OmpR family, sensor histidine kinase MprB
VLAAMSFRRRMVLLAAGAVALSIVLASVVVYIVTRNELRGQVDASLRNTLTPGLPQSVQIHSEAIAPGSDGLARLKREAKSPPTPAAIGGVQASGGEIARSSTRAPQGASGASGTAGQIFSIQRVVGGASTAQQAAPEGFGAAKAGKLVLPAPELGAQPGYVQLFQSNGKLLRSGNRGYLLPVTSATRAVAAGRRNAFFSDATVDGTHVRMLTERAPPGGVWQAALSLGEVDRTLSHLKLVLATVSLAGIALAALLGLLVSRAALVPVRRLTGAAERVARTQDLGHRIHASEEDELGRLAASFNTMLAALERARLAQRQLVSDASHELRTPLTSVQANLDALAMGEELPASERARILAAAQAQLRELTLLVGDLVDLSKTEVEQIELEDVRLDLAAAGAMQRARLHAPQRRFTLDAEPCLVRAAPARLDRAISNLLDNACKWSPQGEPAAPVEVTVREGRFEVRDHGPGIAAEDLARVFDRFYRAPAARSRPGSGLGLAIVRQVAEAHGGAVHAANEPDGGARLTLELPSLKMTDAEVAASRREDSASRREESASSGAVQQVPRLL